MRVKIQCICWNKIIKKKKQDAFSRSQGNVRGKIKVKQRWNYTYQSLSKLAKCKTSPTLTKKF